MTANSCIEGDSGWAKVTTGSSPRCSRKRTFKTPSHAAQKPYTRSASGRDATPQRRMLVASPCKPASHVCHHARARHVLAQQEALPQARNVALHAMLE